MFNNRRVDLEFSWDIMKGEYVTLVFKRSDAGIIAKAIEIFQREIVAVQVVAVSWFNDIQSHWNTA